jgi:hypothetical protein
MNTKQHVEYYRALDQILQHYNRAGFVIRTIHCDGEFRGMMEKADGLVLVPRVPYESRGTQAALTKEPLHSGNSANSNSLPDYHNSSKLLLVTTVSP